MFAKACDVSELKEGSTDVVALNKVLMMLVWPTGGDLKAFQGMCPHMNEPLMDARFDGKNLECRHHSWVFNGTTGECIRPKPCKLAEYPLKVENGEVFIDTEGVTPFKIS